MENNPTQQKNTVESVLDAIRENKVSMRPRIYFMLRMAAMLAVLAAVLIVSIFLFGFIVWSIAASGDSLLLGFGLHGFALFFALFPWWLLLLDVALISLLEILLRQFRFGYKIPALYLLIALLAGTVSIGFLLENVTHVHEALERRADRNQLPVLGGWYEGAKHAPPDGEVCHCVVVAVGTSTLVVRDEWDMATDTLKETVFLQNASDTAAFKIGDRVFVAGRQIDGSIHPIGFQRLPPLPTSTPY